MEFLNEMIRKQFRLRNFEQFTPVQLETFDKIGANLNVVAISPTGTGKTLAYALPLIERFKADGILKGIILAPTQELAQQIGQVFKEWSALTVNVITGGANIKRQIDNLKNKPDVIVATPGRLNELAVQSKKIKFHQVGTVVLDEADYLLADEQIHTVRDIVKRVPSQRQLLLFSATANERLNAVNKWFNGAFEKVVVGALDNQVEHVYIVDEARKRFELLKKLAFVDNMRALVFVKNNVSINDLYEKLTFENIKVAILSSDTHANVRKQAITQFRKGEINYLITSDVASRGLDISDLYYVINYDLPREQSVYLHRSGRVGRMGKKGCVISLISPQQIKELKKIAQQSVFETGIKFSKLIKK